MYVVVGDWIIVFGFYFSEFMCDGEIFEVYGLNGEFFYVVWWSDIGYESMYFFGLDVYISYYEFFGGGVS